MAILLPPEDTEAGQAGGAWSRSRSVYIGGEMEMWEFLAGSPTASPPAHPRLDPGFQSSRNFLALR